MENNQEQQPQIQEVDQQQLKTVKIIVVGFVAVGKSSLIKKYTQDTFNEKHEVTIGADFQSKIVEIGPEKDKLNLQIWDTAGQEQFVSVISAYYRNSDACMFCYDVGSKKSFEQLDYWLKEVRNKCPQGLFTCLVGAQCDKEDDQREVTEEQGKEWALLRNIDVFEEVSAKTGKNIDKIFEIINQKMYEKVSSLSFIASQEKNQQKINLDKQNDSSIVYQTQIDQQTKKQPQKKQQQQKEKSGGCC